MITRYEVLLPRRVAVASALMAYDNGFLRLDGLSESGGTVLSLAFDEVLFLRCCPADAHPELRREQQDPGACIMVDHHSAITLRLYAANHDARAPRDARHYIAFVGKDVFDVIAMRAPEVTEVLA
jgi:hypothetical protein